ncbi:MAG TPA: hypothetical protein VJ302_09175 [Blastocatellia bacterium]|nr:hypothetical protein [Blastocatellia bacterium]
MPKPYSQKLLRIPVFVQAGILVLASDRQPLPRFDDGAFCEILIDSNYVRDQSRLSGIENDREVPFLPVGTKLLAQVNGKLVPEGLRDFLHDDPFEIENCALVEFTLLGDLNLRLRARREATLTDVVCSSPFLEGRENPPAAKSVNHSYTLISTYFEPHRKSHSGNVFNKVFYWSDRAADWLPLRTRRDEIQRGSLTDHRTRSSRQGQLFGTIDHDDRAD